MSSRPPGDPRRSHHRHPAGSGGGRSPGLLHPPPASGAAAGLELVEAPLSSTSSLGSTGSSGSSISSGGGGSFGLSALRESLAPLVEVRGPAGSGPGERGEGGYDQEFSPPADPRFICPICMLVMRRPVQTPCGHRFCASCISHWIRYRQIILVIHCRT